MLPIVIMPQILEPFASKKYKKSGGNITKFSPQNVDSKNILCFIGGFVDSHYLLMYRAFRLSLEREFCINNVRDFNSMYITFNCYDFLRDFMPRALSNGFRFYILAHSWGAKNIIRLCLKYDFSVEFLLSLDCVGHFKITHRPQNIKLWENIYISDFSLEYSRANLAALIGHGQQFIKYADFNIGLTPPHHHASLQEMINQSRYFN
ncbi:hypothetical protein DCO58_02055 [Helicobacter saguini]|uniref:Alpha/beta hydrolase n=1 Tax=Helicobacter saguini TaxID=1548018 RepID=A0A347VRN2_9HELI|nr:hypothetical protein [Helicobacter saguini]MWV62841.1 hypothetical protein [Helicobacter saguini]MWV66490.1 hypothetical protein [Helicobacter saguini]MWV68839.1 hypothetical protein [Helicobacter saguini]MWV71606.1 hypothetical protein [Helicobacter saguini]TLD94410.1 hypothetical protein LS64_005620 [Helicobacter saguini]